MRRGERIWQIPPPSRRPGGIISRRPGWPPSAGHGRGKGRGQLTGRSLIDNPAFAHRLTVEAMKSCPRRGRCALSPQVLSSLGSVFVTRTARELVFTLTFPRLLRRQIFWPRCQVFPGRIFKWPANYSTTASRSDGIRGDDISIIRWRGYPFRIISSYGLGVAFIQKSHTFFRLRV